MLSFEVVEIETFPQNACTDIYITYVNKCIATECRTWSKSAHRKYNAYTSHCKLNFFWNVVLIKIQFVFSMLFKDYKDYHKSLDL